MTTRALLPSTIDVVQRLEIQRRLHVLLQERLTERDQFVVLSRYGIGSAKRTCADIAAAIDLSVSRVQQIATRAIRKLRQPSFCGRIDPEPKSRIRRHKILQQSHGFTMDYHAPTVGRRRRVQLPPRVPAYVNSGNPDSVLYDALLRMYYAKAGRR